MVVRRRSGMLLVIALALAQAGFFVHALKHQLDGPTVPVCLACAAAENTAIAEPPSVATAAVVAGDCPFARPSTRCATVHRFNTHPPRAPPVSL